MSSQAPWPYDPTDDMAYVTVCLVCRGVSMACHVDMNRLSIAKVADALERGDALYRVPSDVIHSGKWEPCQCHDEQKLEVPHG